LIQSLRFTRGVGDQSIQRIISASIFLHPGFLIVDHIHFQYNGFMFGILLWSILQARSVSTLVMSLVSLYLNGFAFKGEQIGKRNPFCHLTQFQAYLHVSSRSYLSLLAYEIPQSPRQPAYFIYLLRSFCMSPQGEILTINFLSLANAVIVVFLASFGPFILMGQLPQLLSRLFPFTRGLNHAYWAPNAWALLTALDRSLLRCMLLQVQ
jgi:alpha-1,3-glucosyltransferase